MVGGQTLCSRTGGEQKVCGAAETKGSEKVVTWLPHNKLLQVLTDLLLVIVLTRITMKCFKSSVVVEVCRVSSRSSCSTIADELALCQDSTFVF